MVWPVKTNPAHLLSGLRSKKNSSRGGVFLLDFSFYRTIFELAGCLVSFRITNIREAVSKHFSAIRPRGRAPGHAHRHRVYALARRARRLHAQTEA